MAWLTQIGVRNNALGTRPALDETTFSAMYLLGFSNGRWGHLMYQPDGMPNGGNWQLIVS